MGLNARKIKVVVIVVVAVLSLVATSCGGSGDPSPKRLTKAEFVAKGDAVCAASEKKLEAAFAEEFTGEGDPTPKQMQAVLRRAATITEGTVAKLKRLEPPATLEKRFDTALADAGRGIAALRKGAAGPDEAKAIFNASEDPFANANKGFEAVGITRCSPGTADPQTPEPQTPEPG